MPTQLEFELSQRLNHISLEQCCRRRITFHLAIRELPELIDDLIETSGVVRAPLAPQILRFTQPLAYLSGKLARVAPTISVTHYGIAVRARALPVALRLTATSLRATGLLITTLLLTTLLPTLRSLLALLTLLTLLTLLLTLLITLLLSLLLTLLITLLITLLLLPIAIASVRTFIQTAPQRVEIVGELPRTIEIFLCCRTIRTTRALLRRLQTFGNIIQTALDRAFIITTTTTLLILLSLLLTVIQRLLTFANTIGNTIARERISSFFQLARRTLLTLTTASHRTR